MILKWVKHEFLLVLIKKHCYSHWEFICYLPFSVVYPTAACCNSNCTWYKLNSAPVSEADECYYNHFHLLLEMKIHISISCRWMKLKYAVYQGGFIPHVILTQNLLQLSTENNCMFSVCDETYGYSAAAPFFFFFFWRFPRDHFLQLH